MSQRYFATIIRTKAKNTLENYAISSFAKYEHRIISISPEALAERLQAELHALNKKHTRCNSLIIDSRPFYSDQHCIELTYEFKQQENYVCRMFLTKIKEGEVSE